MSDSDIIISIIFFVSFLTGGYVGHRISKYLRDRRQGHENEMLQREMVAYRKEIASYTEENRRLKEWVNYWTQVAASTTGYNQQIVDNHNQTVQSNLSMVVDILKSVQQSSEYQDGLSQAEKDKVDDIVRRAKNITPFE